MIKRKQHYIPAFYLRFFTDPLTPCLQTPYVWIFDRSNMSIKNKGPENIGYQKGYNDITDENGEISTIVEDEFQKIEDRAATVIRKILNKQFIIEAEQLELCKFIFSMRERVPYFKKIFKEAIETGELKEIFEKHKVDYVDIQPELKMDSVVRATNLVSHLLMEMSWSLLIAPDEVSFITSDNPVVVRNSIGENYKLCGYISSEYTQITFPISPKMCLYASWQFDREIIEHISEEEVEEINFETFKYSDRFLYSSSRNFDKDILLVAALVREGLIK